MAHHIESMFYTRTKPWHGLGAEVKFVPTSVDALVYAGLNCGNACCRMEPLSSPLMARFVFRFLRCIQLLLLTQVFPDRVHF